MELKITILYGSETGTAQDTAEQIWKSSKRSLSQLLLYYKITN